MSSSQPSFPTIDGLCSPDVLVHLKPETAGILGVNGVEKQLSFVVTSILSLSMYAKTYHYMWVGNKRRTPVLATFFFKLAICIFYLPFFQNSNVKVES